LDALRLKKPETIIQKIAESLKLTTNESKEIYSEIAQLLYSSGVLSVDGNTTEMPEVSPDFQVNDVENVLVIATTQQCNQLCPMCYAMAGQCLPDEMTTRQIMGIIDQLNKMPW